MKSVVQTMFSRELACCCHFCLTFFLKMQAGSAITAITALSHPKYSDVQGDYRPLLYLYRDLDFMPLSGPAGSFLSSQVHILLHVTDHLRVHLPRKLGCII